MPIYAYECQDCGHYLEVIQKISDERLSECPACHKAELKKLLTAPSFRLSGSGWYETDFKKDGKKNIAGEQQPASGTAGASSEAGSGGEKSGGDKSGTEKSSSEKSGASSSSSTAPAADAG